MPSSGESEDDSGSEEELNSHPQGTGPGGKPAGDDMVGTGDSHEVGGRRWTRRIFDVVIAGFKFNLLDLCLLLIDVQISIYRLQVSYH